MGVGAGLYMYDVVVKKFTFAISSPDEFLLISCGDSNYKSYYLTFAIIVHNITGVISLLLLLRSVSNCKLHN